MDLRISNTSRAIAGVIFFTWIRLLGRGYAEAPEIGSRAADTIRRTTVRLTAQLSVIGDPEPNCGFRWWPMGGETSAVTASRSGNFFWATLTNLTPGQSYGFHAWATNNEGASQSADDTFQTVGAEAREMIWSGPSNGSWFVESHWIPNGIPDDGLDHAYLTNGTILLTNSTPPAASFTMSGGSLIFSNWFACLVASNVTVTGGVITLPTAFSNNVMSNRVWILCDTFTLQSPGQIDANARGYAGGTKNQTATGQGPGGGSAGANAGAGGGHGGAGGGGYNGGTGQTNGTGVAHNPGSGGGASTGYDSVGGHGGGAVFLYVNGAATINGMITANGQNSPHSRGGGGSGGGILIQCGVLMGTNGMIRANGGAATGSGGGGGGGRIAILFDPEQQTQLPPPLIELSARPGLAAQYSNGDLGTVYFPDLSLLQGEFFPHSGRLMWTGRTDWVVRNLIASNSWVRFPSNYFGGLIVSNTFRVIGTNAIVESWFTNIACGRLEITNGAQLYIFAHPTNGLPDSAFYGAMVHVDGDLIVGPASYLYPQSFTTNGGSVYFSASSLYVATNAAISAKGRGFLRGINSVGYSVHGHGPGRGAATANSGSGAGYGGRGGRSSQTATRGATYGDPLRPLYPGSGGAGRTGYAGAAGGNGGGLIRFDLTGNAILHGDLNADGAKGVNHGGGSGGAIFLRCVQFFGGTGATVTVRGGDGNNATTDGAGGGGRIAVWFGRVWDSEPDPSDLVISETPPPTFFGTLSVEPGQISFTNDAEAGTIRFVTARKPSGTVIFIR